MRHASVGLGLRVLLGLSLAFSACKNNERSSPPARRANAGVVQPSLADRPPGVVPAADVTIVGSLDAGPCPGALACSGRCIDPMTDSANCGVCGQQCASTAACVAGICLALPLRDAGPVECDAGQVRCGAYCVITATDPLHCGRCGNRCPTGHVCIAGQCAGALPRAIDAGALTCAGEQTRCGAYCVITATDPLHCGRCGNRCPTGQICAEGRCAPAGPGLHAPPSPGGDGGLLPVASVRCTGPQVSCGAYCANPTNDPLNCGRCGARCATSQVCFAGQCSAPGTGLDGGVGGALPVVPVQCSRPQVSCGAYCANPTNDPLNCGRCGARCGAEQVCFAGRCSAPGTGIDGVVRGTLAP